MVINKTEAYLKEEEKESLENNNVRKEGKMYVVESWRVLGVCGERTFFLKEQDVGVEKTAAVQLTIGEMGARLREQI